MTCPRMQLGAYPGEQQTSVCGKRERGAWPTSAAHTCGTPTQTKKRLFAILGPTACKQRELCQNVTVYIRVTNNSRGARWFRTTASWTACADADSYELRTPHCTKAMSCSSLDSRKAQGSIATDCPYGLLPTPPLRSASTLDASSGPTNSAAMPACVYTCVRADVCQFRLPCTIGETSDHASTMHHKRNDTF